MKWHLLLVLVALLPALAGAQSGGGPVLPIPIINPPPSVRMLSGHQITWIDTSNANTVYLVTRSQPFIYSAVIERPADGVVILDAPAGWQINQPLYACRLWGGGSAPLLWFHCWPVTPSLVSLPLLHR